jgi:hypothetical protein
MRCARRLFSAGRFRGRPTPFVIPRGCDFSISHETIAVDAESCGRLKRRPAAPTPALSPDNCPLLTTTPSFLSSRVIMGLRPTQGDEKSLRPATTLYRTVASSFVIPSEAEGSAVRHSCAPHLPANNLHQSSTESSWKHHPPLYHPERSPRICSFLLVLAHVL